MKLRHRRIFIAAALVALASMALIASAAADAAKPAPPYQDFAGCPSEAENEEIGDCVKFDFTSGHIGIGNREIPVTNPIILRGGFERRTENFLMNEEGGIVPAQQTVPGGLIGLTGYKWLDGVVANSNKLKLFATVELAGEVGSLRNATLDIPIKVHLENPFLGNSCYVGSTANPITLQLTTGTTAPPAPNEPITGQRPGPLEEEAGRPEVLTASGGIDVDNSYAVPGASGCQIHVGSFGASLDEVVDFLYGLPSAAGHNTTVLDFSQSVVLPEVIYP